MALRHQPTDKTYDSYEDMITSLLYQLKTKSEQNIIFVEQYLN